MITEEFWKHNSHPYAFETSSCFELFVTIIVYLNLFCKFGYVPQLILVDKTTNELKIFLFVNLSN